MTTHDDLVAAGARLAASGISPGTSGNVSVRDGDHVYMTGTGTDLGALRPSQIARLDPDGRHVDGPTPSKEVAMHLAVYRRNPDLTAAVHVHSANATAVSCLAPWSERSAIPPITPYFVMRVGRTPLIPYRHPGDPALGTLIEELPDPFRAVLLANHGQVVAAEDLGAAVAAAVELEEACRMTLLTLGHNPRLLSDTDAAELAARSGMPW